MVAGCWCERFGGTGSERAGEEGEKRGSEKRLERGGGKRRLETGVEASGRCTRVRALSRSARNSHLRRTRARGARRFGGPVKMTNYRRFGKAAKMGIIGLHIRSRIGPQRPLINFLSLFFCHTSITRNTLKNDYHNRSS